MFDRVRRKFEKPAVDKEKTTGPRWGLRSWQGSVIRAIIQGGSPLTWKELQEATGLNEKALNRALFDLQASGEVYKTEGKHETPARYQVCDKLYLTYPEYYNPKTEIIKWINQWKEVRQLDFPLEHEHFFLEGRHLDDFSKELVCHAKSEVSIVNPFIQDCDLSDTMRDAKKRGANVHVITRPPDDKYPEHLKKKQEYHLRLIEEGIPLVYDERVHAKIIVVDRAVAIISSMNFYAESSAGVSWEVGLISLDTKVVRSITDAFSRARLNIPKTSENTFAKETSQKPSIEPAALPKETQSNTIKDLRQKYPKAYEKWTTKEDDALLTEYRNGIAISIIAKTHQRKPGAIRTRLEKLGLLTPKRSQEGNI